MKKAFLFLLSLTLAVASYAADTKPIEDEFMKYWAAYSKKDFVKAAAEILPSDLEATKAAVLPVFLTNQAAKGKEAQEVLAAFFGKTVGKAREAMTAADVYVALNRVVATGSPELFEALKESTISIIFTRTMTPDTAEVHFQVKVQGQGDTDAESLVKKDGRWWIKMRDDPKQTAESFKELFTSSK